MSVDYNSNYGIGYKACESEEISDEEELEDGLIDYLYNEAGDNFDSFEVGSAWSGDIDGTYLIIKDPIKNGLDLTEAKTEIDAEIKRLKLDVESEFGVVGGLYIS
tara:strand:- start:438 stop:752 length:315 start_codon:yes stop_codon:yes gene_type:complete